MTHRHPIGMNEPIASSTIDRLEEQIQLLKVKVEGINARLESVTSILQETHPNNVSADDQTSIGDTFLLIARIR